MSKKFVYAVSTDGVGFLQVNTEDYKFAIAYKPFFKHGSTVFLGVTDAMDFLTELRQRGVAFTVQQVTL